MAKKRAGIKINKELLVPFLLRSGLATVFLYAAVAAFLEPNAWIGFVPQFVRNIIPGNLTLILHSAWNTFLAVWLLSNKKTYYASIFSILTLLAIIVFNLGSLDIVFRDIAILLSAVALAIMSYKTK